MNKQITSTSNPKIKNIIKLRKPRERKKQGLIIVEGKVEISLALKTGWKIKELFFNDEFVNNETVSVSVEGHYAIEVSKEVFEKIAYRETPDGYLAIFESKSLELEDIKLSDNPLIVVLEGVEKPGNLGAILRSANAAGVDVVILNDSQIDLYNPNAIRSSIGSIFDMQVLSANRSETIKWLEEKKIKRIATSKAGEKAYTEANLKEPVAIVMGSEHDGLSEKWQKEADEFVYIPMEGIVSSLNLSVSTAVILFEAKRQRK